MRMSAEHPEGDRETYQGFGFTGRCLGQIALPRSVGSSPAAGSESDTPHKQEPAASETNPAALECLSCNSKTILLAGHRVWCPRCKTSSELQGGGSITTIAAVIGVVLLLLLVIFYVQGTVDHLAYSIGLNWETCGLSDGEILCGDKLPVGTAGVSESIKDGVGSLFW